VSVLSSVATEEWRALRRAFAVQCAVAQPRLEGIAGVEARIGVNALNNEILLIAEIPGHSV
jgi:hypothetical protein